MLYNGYLKTLTQKLDARLDEISAEYNFDLGDEFEIALCHVLREVLPQKYGICRGFVVSRDGRLAGDDIIIYNQERFSTLRLLPQDHYGSKEKVPVEAVCAYIEAKHTLHIRGEDGQSLRKVCSQICAVKTIPRDERTVDFYHPYFKNNALDHPVFSDKGFYPERSPWPKSLNPVFGAVFARRVALAARSNCLEAKDATQHLVGASIPARKPPDLIVAGDSNVIAPCIRWDKSPLGVIIGPPFYVQGSTDSLQVIPCKKMAFAIGVCLLLYALDTLRLGRMPWEAIINDGFQQSSTP